MAKTHPLQNRVHPDGRILAVPARGTLMGNRGGRLHLPDGTLRPAQWRSAQWIICQLSFRGRQREVMGPGYTELFFLDEPTALAAGHRPCFECRHAAAMEFARRWTWPDGPRARAAEIDHTLHAERRAPHSRAPLGTLPPGAMATDGRSVWAQPAAGPLLWSFEGYRRASAPTGPLEVLTPPGTLRALRAGYEPLWHPSAD